jgi:hypothetical protein
MELLRQSIFRRRSSFGAAAPRQHAPGLPAAPLHRIGAQHRAVRGGGVGSAIFAAVPRNSYGRPAVPGCPSVDRQTAAGSAGDEVLLARACRPAEICTAAKRPKSAFLRSPGWHRGRSTVHSDVSGRFHDPPAGSRQRFA